MDLTQLQYFRTVARLEHITQAASVLHITQPALSRAISRLEDELGAKLFERDGNRIHLSPAGAVYLKRVDQAVMQLENGRNEVQGLNGELVGDVCFASFTSGMLSEAIQAYLLSHPNVNVRHRIQSPQQMEHSLELGEIEFAFSLTPIESPNITWTPVAEDELIAIVSTNHPLASRDCLMLPDLQGEALAVSDAGFGTRQLVERFCRQSGFRPRILYDGMEGNLIMNLLRENACVFMIPLSAHFWRVENDRNTFPDSPDGPPKPPIKALRIVAPSCRFSYGVCQMKGKRYSGVTQEFYETILWALRDWTARWEQADWTLY